MSPESPTLPTTAAAGPAATERVASVRVTAPFPTGRGLSWVGVASALAACLVLLTATTVVHLDDLGEDRWRNLSRRYWEDTYLAIGHRLTGRFPVSYRAVRGYKLPDARGFEEMRPTLTQAAEAAGIRPWQFWRTLPAELFARPKPVPIFPRYDDSGRPLLLALGFALLGGVSPYLLFWLGLFAAAPALAWVAAELRSAEAAPSAVALLLLVGLSPFVADVLALHYSALGFYLVALFALTAFASYACLNPRVSPRGLITRAFVAGLLFGISSACRASCLVLLPGFVLAAALAALRAAGPASIKSRGRVLAGFLLAMVGVVGPYVAVVRGIDAGIARTLSKRKKPVAIPPQVHPFWHGVWIGLGDFDRTKGYTWSDQAAFDAIVEAGGTPSTTTYYDPKNEAISRNLIVDDVASDPGWFAAILLKRLGATVTQWKLWPWPPSSGRSVRERSAPNEGQIDAYYGMATPIDRFGVAGHDVELPVPLLVAPTVALIGVALVARSRGAPAFAVERRLAVLACVAAATLGHPVILTTASALETETFAFTYLIGAAFAVELLAGLRAGRDREERQPFDSRMAANAS